MGNNSLNKGTKKNLARSSEILFKQNNHELITKIKFKIFQINQFFIN